MLRFEHQSIGNRNTSSTRYDILHLDIFFGCYSKKTNFFYKKKIGKLATRDLFWLLNIENQCFALK